MNFDSFLQEKEGKGILIFMICLEDEFPFLDADDHWIHHLHFRTHIVRLTEDEMLTLDFGRHPKVYVTKNGKEVGYLNGMPECHEFQKQVTEMLSNLEIK